jgi:hypothetical protein
MTSPWHSLIPFLPFPAAANSEDSTQFSSDYSSVLLELLNSQFQFSNLISVATNRLSLYSLGSDFIEDAVFSCRLLLCYLTTRSRNHRKHSYCCVFAGTCILSRCLAMGRYVTVFTVLHRRKVAITLTKLCLVESSRIESDLSGADAESFVFHRIPLHLCFIL